MTTDKVSETIRAWQALSDEEKTAARLAAVPGHVVASMAMAGEPVSEQWALDHGVGAA